MTELPLTLKCPCCKFGTPNQAPELAESHLITHLTSQHKKNEIADHLGKLLLNIQKELQRLESLHLDFDRFATTQVAGQIQLLKSILDHEYYK